MQGRDEASGEQVGPKFAPLRDPTAPLEYEEVKAKLEQGGFEFEFEFLLGDFETWGLVCVSLSAWQRMGSFEKAMAKMSLKFSELLISEVEI